MAAFDWNEEKNEWLKKNRGISFQEVEFFIHRGGLLDTLPHPNQTKYPNQGLMLVDIREYVYVVPFVESDDGLFLKTIIPSRKATKIFLKGRMQHGKT